jgi:hypothetical protein
MKYSKSLRVSGNTIFSYNTPVAKIGKKYVSTNKYYSKTTSKHINYAAGLFRKKVKRNYK